MASTMTAPCHSLAYCLPTILCAIIAGNFTATDVFDDRARLAVLAARARVELAKIDVLLVPTVLEHYLIAEVQAGAQLMLCTCKPKSSGMGSSLPNALLLFCSTRSWSACLCICVHVRKENSHQATWRCMVLAVCILAPHLFAVH